MHDAIPILQMRKLTLREEKCLVQGLAASGKSRIQIQGAWFQRAWTLATALPSHLMSAFPWLPDWPSGL